MYWIHKIPLNLPWHIKWREIHIMKWNRCTFYLCQLKRGSQWDWHWLVGHEEQINPSNTCNPDLNQLRETCRSGLDDTYRSVTDAFYDPSCLWTHETQPTTLKLHVCCHLQLHMLSWKFYKLVKHGFLSTSDRLSVRDVEEAEQVQGGLTWVSPRGATCTAEHFSNNTIKVKHVYHYHVSEN